MKAPEARGRRSPPGGHRPPAPAPRRPGRCTAARIARQARPGTTAGTRDHRTYLGLEGVPITRLPRDRSPLLPQEKCKSPDRKSPTGSPAPGVLAGLGLRDLASSFSSLVSSDFPFSCLHILLPFEKKIPSSLFCASLLPSCSQVTQSVCSPNWPFCSQMPAGK